MLLLFGSSIAILEPALVLPVAVDIACKSVIVLLAAWLITLNLRQASAAVRHMVWSAGVVCVLLIPLISIFVPSMRFGLIPEAFSAIAYPVEAIVVDVEGGGGIEEVGLVDGEVVVAARGGVVVESKSWSILMVTVWASGCVIYLVFMLLGFLRLNRACRVARPMLEKSWLDLIDEQSQRLGIRQSLSIMWADRTAMPMTFGLFRPTILLPETATDWTVDRRHAVLVHELAHIRRYDCVTQFLAHLAVAIYWFNPLAHLAARRLRTEREYACDDFVLRTGAPATGYANHLLEIAKTLRASVLTAGTAVSMARRSALEGRMLAILESPRSRKPVRAMAVVMTFVVGTALTVIVGSIHLTTPAPGVALIPGVPAPGVTLVPGVVPALGVEASGSGISGGDVVDGGEVVGAGSAVVLQLFSEGTGEPLADAKLEITINGNTISWQSDVSGRYSLPRPRGGVIEKLAITVYAEGYVPKLIRFDRVGESIELGDTFKIVLLPGKTIGGLVQNQMGKAISGTSVHLRFDWKEIHDDGYSVTIPDQVVQTNQWGWWRSESVPESLDHLQIKFTDSYYVGDQEYDPTTPEVNNKLRDKIHTRTLKRVTIEGDGVV